MLSPLVFLISATLIFALLVFVHIRLLVAVWGAKDISPAQKWLGWFPFWTPIAAWNAKLRRLPIVWSILLVAYVAVRVLQ